MLRRPGRWIPPQGLVFGQLAHGASWIVLLVLALQGVSEGGFPALGWLHLVALGWLTMTALSVLFHVVPAFTDVVWRWEVLARGSLVVYAAGVLVLVVALFADARSLLPWGGSLIVLALAGYALPAALTLRVALRNGSLEAGIARGLATTLTWLLVAAALGFAFSWAFDGRLPRSILSLAPVHADVALIGWLTALVMGVSARTVAPIAGARSRAAWRHVTAVSAEIAGMIVLAAAWTLGAPAVMWIGVAIVGFGVAIYVADLASVLRHATVRHRPPQAFLVAGALWLTCAFVLFVAALCGAPCMPALVFVALIGWIGQMVNGHLHHIGVRLIATIYRGDDDETRPGELLSPALSWIAFAAFQVALLLGAGGSIEHVSPLVAAGAAAGLAGWTAMAANTAMAVRRANRSTVISLLRHT